MQARRRALERQGTEGRRYSVSVGAEHRARSALRVWVNARCARWICENDKRPVCTETACVFLRNHSALGLAGRRSTEMAAHPTSATRPARLARVSFPFTMKFLEAACKIIFFSAQT
jgi:hypothetical protein